MFRQFAVHNKGFTLIELITVIIVLAVVSVGISGFIRTGVQIYSDTIERDQLLSDSRFVVERINRELRRAVPNSVRVDINSSLSIQCLEFVPAEWVSFYTNLTVLSDASISATATVVEFADNPVEFSLETGDFAIVYPVNNSDVYNLANNKRKEITSCADNGSNTDCNTADDPGGIAELTFSSAFDDYSPASRLYIARKSVSYCAHNSGEIYRRERAISSVQVFDDSDVLDLDVLMAENLRNDFNDVDNRPFKINEATLTRNSLVQILFKFERSEEMINYNNEVHLLNVP